MTTQYQSKNYLNLKPGSKYRVIAIPVPKPKEYPQVGSIGEVCWTSSCNGACLKIDDKSFIIPFECLENADDIIIKDDELIAIMINNPYGVYKLLRGLWRMTKDKTIRNFMECGELPEENELVKRNKKSPNEYDKQWEEAAISGAFSTEVVS